MTILIEFSIVRGVAGVCGAACPGGGCGATFCLSILSSIITNILEQAWLTVSIIIGWICMMALLTTCVIRATSWGGNDEVSALAVVEVVTLGITCVN